MPAAESPEDKAQRRNQLRREVMRTVIVDAALELLLAGDREITMEEIADSAAVSTASLYNYFPGKKQELYKALVHRVLTTDAAYMARAFDPRKTPVEELNALGEAYLKFGLEHPGYFRLIAQPNTIVGLDERQVERLARSVRRFLHRVAEIVERGQSEELPDGVRLPDTGLDAFKVAEVLHSTWNGVLGLSLRDDALGHAGDDLRELAQIATTIISRGLVSPPDSTQPQLRRSPSRARPR